LTPPRSRLTAWLPPSLATLHRDALFVVLLLVLLAFSVAAPAGIAGYARLVDWPTIAALAGLLLLTTALEASGALQRLGDALVARLATERALALALVGAAALLSTVLTNDVALFVVVPLTVSVCRLARLPATRLVVFEALAVNAGSTLSPIGNPQNLFLWQQWQVSFGRFVLEMAPLVALLMALLLALTVLAFPARALGAHGLAAPTPLDRPLLVTALLLYAPFLVATDLHHAGIALALLAAIVLAVRARLLREVDWGLLLVFVLMFVDLRLLAGLDTVRGAMSALGLDRAAHLYWAGIVLSQGVSNVPATIALAEYSQDWRVIAHAVGVGGFGIAIGSLANLIALRLLGERRAWLAFHAWSLPFLALAMLAGWAALFWL
jgi:di/tricarboxylate transporter